MLRRLLSILEYYGISEREVGFYYSVGVGEGRWVPML